MRNLIVTIALNKQLETEFENLGTYFDFEITRLDIQKIIDGEVDFTRRLNYSKVFIVLNIDKTPYDMYKFVALLKAEHNVEVYFVSKNTDPDEHVRWFTLGACNYFIEPCKAEEILRYATQVSRKQNFIISDSNFRVDLKAQTVYYLGREIEVLENTIKLIVYLMEHSNTIISREQIMKNVYSKEKYHSARNIDTQIKNLRRATNFDIISTIRGQGYIYNQTSQQIDIGE